MTYKKEEANGRVWWLWFGFFATFGYAILVVVFIREYEVGFIDRVGRLELNAIGDFLAGVFAPLAFLWLFVATMMQSKELRLQREELALNREEMREARGVMKDQAQAAKDQAETASLQTQAVREQISLQREVAEATYKVSLLDTRVTIFKEIREGMNRLRQMTPAELDTYASTFSRAQLVFGADIAKKVVPILGEIVTVMVDLHMFETDNGTGAFQYYQDRLESDNWKGAPIQAYEIDEFKERLIDLIERCDGITDQISETGLLENMRAVMTINVSLSTAEKIEP